MVGTKAAPTTAFVITFTRPVKMAMSRCGHITPHVDFTVSGDDPTDAASQVFTLTPDTELSTNSDYVVGMNDGGTDSASAPLQEIANLEVVTLPAPSVVKHSRRRIRHSRH